MLPCNAYTMCKYSSAVTLVKMTADIYLLR